jgi:F0F1-type ATP synthase membrane subunit b/b'
VNSKTKQFLILLVCVALTGWIGVNWLLGPPGLSKDYLAEHRAAHESYLEVIKSDDYKRYIQRPDLVHLEAVPRLRQRVELVNAYVSNEAFQTEQHRIHLYTLFFELFNAAIVVVLVLRLAKAPLLSFLDTQVEELRERINQAARSRKSSLGRRAGIEDKLAHIAEEELRLNAETENRLERELAELAEANHYSLGLHERELAERKRAETHAAELVLKRRLVDEAVDALVAQISANQSPESHDKLIDQFNADLEVRT